MKIFGLLCGILVCGWVSANVKPQDWVQETQSALTIALRASSDIPYREAQQTQLKSYFKKFSDLVEVLETDEKQRKKLVEYFKKTDVSVLCARLFMSKNDWERIEKGCRRNSFFICADDIQKYPSMLASLNETIPSIGLSKCSGFSE